MKISYIENYKKITQDFFKKQHGVKNEMSVPKITKISINTGIGRMAAANENTDNLIKDLSDKLARITGQKPRICKAKKSIAGFKLREGTPVGISVTLRGKKKEDFFDRFVNIVMPRTRDFWGVERKKFDKAGNLTLGVKEMNAFPELSFDILKPNFGIEINFVTNAKSKEKAIHLFETIGFPLKPATETPTKK